MKTLILGFLFNSLIVYSALMVIVYVVEYGWKRAKSKTLYHFTSVLFLLSFLVLLLPGSFRLESQYYEGSERIADSISLNITDNQILFSSLHTLIDGLLVCYFLVLTFLLSRELANYINLLRSTKRLAPLDPIPQCLMDHGISVSVSPHSDAFSFGIISKKIVIPELSDNRLRDSVLYHEYSHAKDRDFLFHLTERVVTHVFFFNPFVRLIKQKINFYRECKADEFVVENGVDPYTYSEHLVNMAGLKSQNRLKLYFKPKSSMLLRRLKKLLCNAELRSNRYVSILSISLALLLLGSLSTFSKSVSQDILSVAIQKPDESVSQAQNGVDGFRRKADALKTELLKDGLVDGKSSFEIEFRPSGMFINGQKKDKALNAKYTKKINDLLGENFAPGGKIYLTKADYK